MMLDMSSIDVLEAFGKFRRELGRLRNTLTPESGLGHLQGSILYRLTFSNASLTELAEHTLSDPAAITRAITSLKKSGWVERMPNPEDSRSSIIALTAKGRTKAAFAKRLRAKMSARINDVLSANERAELIRLLDKVTEGTRDHNEE
jgi:DNA-binding MarR family transcriptional regulator